MADSWVSRADVAQLVEHSLGKGEVTSSILVISSRSTSAQWAVNREQLPVGSRNCSLFTGHCPLFLSGSNSVVESQPSKLLVASSILVSRSRFEAEG